MSESPDNQFIPSHWKVARHYCAPFKAINAAMRRTIELYALRDNGGVKHDDTPGSTRYTVDLSDEVAIIYIEYIREDLTLIRCYPFVQSAYVMNKLDPNAVDKVNILMHHCWEEVAEAMRYTHPDFTRVAPSALTPPIPSWNLDPDKCLAWKETYAHDMTDKEFAELLGIDHGTLRNYKTRKRQNRTRKRSKL